MENVFKCTIYTVCAHSVKSVDHSQTFEKTKDAIRRRLGLKIPCCGRIKLISDKAYNLTIAYAEAKVLLEKAKGPKEDENEPGMILPRRAGTNCNFALHEAGHEREFKEYAYLRLGWCPDCEERLKKAKKYGHHRNLNPRDNHVIENFWAWRTQSWHTRAVGGFKSEDMPFAVLDMNGECPYKRQDPEQLTDDDLRRLHYIIKDKSTWQWHPWSLFNNERKYTKNMLPRLLNRVDEVTGEEYLPIEEYQILFSLYEIQPSKLIPEHRGFEYDYGCESISLELLTSVKRTTKLYGKDVR